MTTPSPDRPFVVPQQAETVAQVVAASERGGTWTGDERITDARIGVWHRWKTSIMASRGGRYGHRTACGAFIDLRFERTDVDGPVDCWACAKTR